MKLKKTLGKIAPYILIAGATIIPPLISESIESSKGVGEEHVEYWINRTNQVYKYFNLAPDYPDLSETSSRIGFDIMIGGLGFSLMTSGIAVKRALDSLFHDDFQEVKK